MREHIILSDFGSDPDDDQSLISYLFFENEFNTRAIVLTRPSGERSNVVKILDAYKKDYSKFKAYDSNYTTPAKLLRRVVDGRRASGVNRVAKIIRNSEATRKNPLYITVWGNIHTLAEALEKLKNKVPTKEYLRILNKIVCVSVDGWNKAQDPRPYTWLENYAKRMKWIRIENISRAHWVKGVYAKDTGITNRQYVQFLKSRAGALGKRYDFVSNRVLSPGFPASKTLYSMKEGDSPTWVWALWGNNKPKVNGIAGKYERIKASARHWREVQDRRYEWEGWKAAKTYNREEIMNRYKQRVELIYG